MYPCGTLQLSDLKVGQVIKWTGRKGKTSIWIIIDELPQAYTAHGAPTRSMTLWCLATPGIPTEEAGGATPGMQTTYRFSHTNVSSYEVISGV